MKRFDVANMTAYGHDQREKNVLCETREFKMRVIALGPGESIPECEMASYVIFVCVEGEAEVRVSEDRITVSKGQVVVSEPATLSMTTHTGSRLLGIQVTKGNENERRP